MKLKNIKKSEVIGMENEETKDGIILEENEATEVGKPKWSLKKKLMIGGGVLAGLALGAVALVVKNAVPANNQMEASDDYEDVDNDTPDSEEIPETVAE